VEHAELSENAENHVCKSWFLHINNNFYSYLPFSFSNPINPCRNHPVAYNGKL